MFKIFESTENIRYSFNQFTTNGKFFFPYHVFSFKQFKGDNVLRFVKIISIADTVASD